MNILTKLKDTAISVLPVMLIVCLLGFTIVPVEKILLFRFIVGGLLLIIGLTVFLLGVDLGIQPVGERCGAELTKKRSLALLLTAAFIIGFIVTAAEPDIQVFGNQVRGIFPFVNKLAITFVIAAGVGLFLMLGLFRIVLNFSIKITLLIAYTVLFVLVIFAPESFIGIAFDSGGATTGPMTVPFILALGLGVSSVRSDNNNSFGLTGIASIGPVTAVIIYAIFLKINGSSFQALQESDSVQNVMQTSQVVTDGLLGFAGSMKQIFSPFGRIIRHVLVEASVSIAPLFLMFLVFQFTMFKMTVRQMVRIIIGFIYSYVGLTIFLTGVSGGFMQAGAALGESLGALTVAGGGWWYVLLIGTGFVLGAIIVCAEPAVWVLSEQVEQVSGGTIKRKVLLTFLSIGTALAIGLSMLRAVTGFNFKLVLIPGYIIAMLLMIFCPPIFTGIAFDSGGVASGPLTSTFILSFTLGAAVSGKGGNDSFGVIALVAMMPLIGIQVMGIIYKLKSAVNAAGKLAEKNVANTVESTDENKQLEGGETQ